MDSVNQLAQERDGVSLLRDVTRMYVRAQRQTVACCGPQSTARCHVLGELARSGPLRLTELAALLDADKSWTSRTVGAMTREGLLSCGDEEDDARAVQIELTKAGRVHWLRMDAALRRHAEGALSRLSAQELRIVHEGLELLRSILEQETGTGTARPPRQATGGAGRQDKPLVRRDKRVRRTGRHRYRSELGTRDPRVMAGAGVSRLRDRWLPGRGEQSRQMPRSTQHE